MRSLVLLALAMAVAAGVVFADQSARRVVVTVNRTPGNNGKLMYASYCSSCHGLDGKGNGPTAAMLRKQPADLTTLSKNYRGRFPFERVKAVLEFGAAYQGQRTAPMPIWGPILAKSDPANPGQNMGMLRIINLNRYLESIQEK